MAEAADEAARAALFARPGRSTSKPGSGTSTPTPAVTPAPTASASGEPASVKSPPASAQPTPAPPRKTESSPALKPRPQSVVDVDAFDSRGSARGAGAGAEDKVVDPKTAEANAQRKAIMEMALKATTEDSEEEEEFTLDLGLGDLDMTTEDIDFGAMNEDIAKFQQVELVKEALEKGVDLRLYASQIEKELQGVSRDSVNDYIAEQNSLAELHGQIAACDSILATMEKLLSKFQSELGNISTEIKHLQDESLSMNVKLNNRKEVENKLSEFVSEMVIPDDLVSNICEAEVNEAYLEYLTTLNHKIKFTQAHDALAVNDVAPEIERLRWKAASRAREFLLVKLAQLKKPKTNTQIIQQNVLLRFRYMNSFLNDHAPEIAGEIRDQYTETMSRLYQANFKTYVTQLSKLLMEIGSRGDLLGAEESTAKNFFTSKFAKSKASVFTVGDRIEVLKQLEAPAIVAHVAEQNKAKFPFEELYRSASHLLLDAATTEFLFADDFFGRRNNLFQAIFGKAEQVIMEFLEEYVRTCHDGIGMLLVIRITHQHRLLMNRRRIPALEQHFDRVNIVVWPRFKAIFDSNVESMQQAQSRATGHVDVHPHYITRRYAEFLASLLELNAEYGDESLSMNLSRLRREYEKLLQHLSEALNNRRDQLVFQLNNYDVILAVLNERNIASDETTRFEELHAATTALFVEEALGRTYGPLIKLLKDLEPIAQTTPKDLPTRYPPAMIEGVVKDFGQNWKQGIDAIHADVLKYFPNFVNANKILKAVLTQLIVYYQRFTDLLEKNYRGAPLLRHLVNIQNIYYEIKKSQVELGNIAQ